MFIRDCKLKFAPFPTLLYNYRQLIFTDDNQYIKKMALGLLIPFALLADIIIYIPRKIKFLMKERKRRNHNIYNMDKSKLI